MRRTAKNCCASCAVRPNAGILPHHNLFTTGDGEGSLKWGSTNVYTEKPDGTPVYDFTITDRIFDALVDANVVPLVEIGFMPEALSTHPEPYRHTFPKGDIATGWSYPPKDETKWMNLVAAYAAHLKQRYGEAGGLVAVGGLERAGHQLLARDSGGIRPAVRSVGCGHSAVLPHARIGGPEATGISDKSEVFLRQFLEHCAHGANAATGGTGAPLDFISYHPKGSPKWLGIMW